MNYYQIIEPLVHDKYWSRQYTEGIKQDIQRVKGKYAQIGYEDLAKVAAEAETDGLRPVVIVNCISKAWISESLPRFDRAGVHPLLLTPVPPSLTGAISSVSFDFYNVFYTLCKYLENAGRFRIALFGLNPSSANDLEKQRAFSRYYGLPEGEIDTHIFWNYGALDDCCRRFFERRADYNAVICANDIVAVKLIHFLKNRRVFVPRDMYVATMGNTYIGERIAPKLTVAEFDCVAIGRQAAKTYAFLAKNPGISSVNAYVTGNLIARESTGETPTVKPSAAGFDSDLFVDFYADRDVRQIFTLESFFKGIDELDKQILYGMLRGKKYAALAEELYTSESTVKYRVKRMIELAGCKNKTELLEVLMQYVDL